MQLHVAPVDVGSERRLRNGFLGLLGGLRLERRQLLAHLRSVDLARRQGAVGQDDDLLDVYKRQVFDDVLVFPILEINHNNLIGVFAFFLRLLKYLTN